LTESATGGRRPSPDLIDVFIILLLATALVIFVMTVATQFVNSSAFITLPAFLNNAYSAIWTSLASGSAGIGLVVVKTLMFRKVERPNYMPLALLTAAGIMAAVLLIAVTSRWLNPAPTRKPPSGVALIDTSTSSGGPIRFEFASLPGSQINYRLEGTYSYGNDQVSGEMNEGTIFFSQQWSPAFTESATRLTFRGCYYHPVYGIDQMEFTQIIGKASNSIPLDFKMEPGKSFSLPPMKFSFRLPPEAEKGRTWLCAAIENTVGFIPVQ